MHIDRLKWLLLGALFSSLSLLTSCGDLYRPVANPVQSGGGAPAVAHLAIVANSNPGGTGTMYAIDVSGDTVTAVLPVGVTPIHAAIVTGASRVSFANRDENTVSVTYPTTSSPSQLISFVPPSTVALQPSSTPVYMATTSSFAYAADSGNNTVAAISNSQNAATSFIPVGNTPVSLVALPNNQKVYCLNQADGTVTSISAVDNTILTPAIPVGAGSSVAGATLAKPWMAARADSSAVFVLNPAESKLYEIDTTLDQVVGSVPVGASPNQVIYDGTLGRLYVANTGDNTVSIFDGHQTPPKLLSTVTTGTAPTSVTALADGSRFYVANSAVGTVTVYNASNFALRTTITAGTTPIWIDSAPDSSKVYAANRDSDSVTIIRTSDDTVPITVQMPTGSRPVFVAVSP